MITYEGPEDYFLEVWYGAMIGETEFEINSISIEKKLPEGEHEVYKKSYSEHEFFKKSDRESKMSSNGMNLEIDCKHTKLTQKIGEQIEVYVTGIQIVTDRYDDKKMRFTSYKISNSRQSTLYNDIKFETTYNRKIDTLTCVSTIFGAPPPPSPPPPPSVNISKLIPSIEEILKESPSPLTVTQISGNKILISNPPKYTLQAIIEDNKFTYFMPKVYTEQLTDTQEDKIGKLLVGGRRKPKRKATKRCLLRTQRGRKQSKRKLRKIENLI
jgi:hypothetical protein